MPDTAARLTPPPSPPSPSTSFYDVSDDEESDYNTVAHSKSGKGVKLLFSKSKVIQIEIGHEHPGSWSVVSPLPRPIPNARRCPSITKGSR